MAAVKRKLSFKEKHALETLPRRMETLQSAIAALRDKLADPALFARDQSAFNKAAGELSDQEAALDDSEQEWLRLELLREEAEG